MSEISANVDTTPLDGDDKFEILDHLKNLKAHCYKLGTALKLSDDTLECIRRESAGDNAEAMIKIINSWLKLNYNWQRFGRPTWKALVEAVANPIGGNNAALAIKIAEKHKAGTTLPEAISQQDGDSTGQDQTSGSNSATTRNGHCQQQQQQPAASADSSTNSTSLMPITYQELCTDLKEVAAHWHKLGIQLNFSASQLTTIQANVNQVTSVAEHGFSGVLQTWEETKPKSFTKEVLVEALRGIDEKGLAGRIERNADFKMSLRSLTNSLQQCKHKYFTLGIQLGLSYDQVKKFQSYAGESSVCLSELLREYVYNMSPDVEEVCQAVKQVGRNDIAMELREGKYKGRQFQLED